MQYVQFLIVVAVGAGFGAAMGYFGKCSSGACPLTSTPWRGAAYGAVLAALFASSVLFQTGCEPRAGKNKTAAAPAPAKAAQKAGAKPSASGKSASLVHLQAAADFDKEVLQAKGVVVVDFYADWCPPCRMLGPVVEKAAEEYAGKVKFVKVNVDKHQDLAGKYEVTSIPRLIIFKDGRQVDSDVGYRDGKALKKWIDKYLD